MKKSLFATVVISALLLVTACSHKKNHKKKDKVESTTAYTIPVTQDTLSSMTATWPGPSQAAITALSAKYGLPQTITDEMVVWTSTAPFKRSIVYKEEINHQFPMQHSDVLMQTVDYRVPLDKVAHLAKFDGSLLVDRTKGELSTRNDIEEMNILSLNLADKIVRGQMTAEQARREYARNAQAFEAGSSGPLVSSLMFQSTGNTQDPDRMMQSQEARKKREMAAPVDVEEVIED